MRNFRDLIIALKPGQAMYWTMKYGEIDSIAYKLSEEDLHFEYQNCEMEAKVCDLIDESEITGHFEILDLISVNHRHVTCICFGPPAVDCPTHGK
jgi:hypothetical protein